MWSWFGNFRKNPNFVIICNWAKILPSSEEKNLFWQTIPSIKINSYLPLFQKLLLIVLFKCKLWNKEWQLENLNIWSITKSTVEVEFNGYWSYWELGLKRNNKASLWYVRPYIFNSFGDSKALLQLHIWAKWIGHSYIPLKVLR